MRVMIDLKGLHSVKKKLASGAVKRYYYAWRGGPAIDEKYEYGTVPFAKEFDRLKKEHKAPKLDELSGLIDNYKTKGLPKAKSTRKSYTYFLDDLRTDHGSMSIAAIEELGSRTIFEDWRDKWKNAPRMADLAWTVARRVFNYSLNAELIKRNPCRGGSGYERGSRKEIIWTDTEISLMRAKAPKHIVDALTLAIETGQRQGNLLSLKWSAYDGTRLHLQTSKRGKKVSILVSAELRLLLEELKAQNTKRPVAAQTILTNSRGKPWTEDGFRTSWGKATAKAGIEGKTFHDLRGTFITKARRSGSTAEHIAEITGHSKKSVNEVLEAHYLATDLEVSDAVILKLERAKK
jgi:integrase